MLHVCIRVPQAENALCNVELHPASLFVSELNPQHSAVKSLWRLVFTFPRLHYALTTCLCLEGGFPKLSLDAWNILWPSAKPGFKDHLAHVKSWDVFWPRLGKMTDVPATLKDLG